MSKRDLSEVERKAWQAVTRHVRPLDRRGSDTRRGSLSFSEDSELANRAASSLRAPLSAPQDRQKDKAVRRGRQSVEAALDLHGHTQDSAWRILPQFLARQRGLGAKCVIVITGKGKQGEGVLRRNFLLWLESPEAAGLVSGFAPAHPKHGGRGAWYVYLRR